MLHFYQNKALGMSINRRVPDRWPLIFTTSKFSTVTDSLLCKRRRIFGNIKIFTIIRLNGHYCLLQSRNPYEMFTVTNVRPTGPYGLTTIVNNCKLSVISIIEFFSEISSTLACLSNFHSHSDFDFALFLSAIQGWHPLYNVEPWS